CVVRVRGPRKHLPKSSRWRRVSAFSVRFFPNHRPLRIGFLSFGNGNFRLWRWAPPVRAAPRRNLFSFRSHAMSLRKSFRNWFSSRRNPIRNPRKNPTSGKKPQLRVENLEDRITPAVNLLQSYDGINFAGSGGFVPPDTDGAAGPVAYV